MIGHFGIGQFVVRLTGGGNAELLEGETSILVFALIGSKSLFVSRWCLGNMFVKDHTASFIVTPWALSHPCRHHHGKMPINLAEHNRDI